MNEPLVGGIILASITQGGKMKIAIGTDSFCTAIWILGCYQEKLIFRSELCRFTNINVKAAGIALNS